MALLNPLGRKLIVVFKRPDVVVWIRAEQEPEHLRVGCRLVGPRIPDLVAKGIRDEVVLGSFEDLVRADAWGRRVGLRRGVVVLGWEESQVLSPQLASEGSDVTACFVRLAVHIAVNVILIFHDDGKLAVVESKLRLQWLVHVPNQALKNYERLTRSLMFALPQIAIRSSTMHTLPWM